MMSQSLENCGNGKGVAVIVLTMVAVSGCLCFGMVCDSEKDSFKGKFSRRLRAAAVAQIAECLLA